MDNYYIFLSHNFLVVSRIYHKAKNITQKNFKPFEILHTEKTVINTIGFGLVLKSEITFLVTFFLYCLELGSSCR